VEPNRLDSFLRIVGRNADMLDCEIMYRRRYLFGGERTAVWQRAPGLAAASCFYRTYAEIICNAIALGRVYSLSIYPASNTKSIEVYMQEQAGSKHVRIWSAQTVQSRLPWADSTSPPEMV
jgi:hypothetical protein